MLGPPRCGSIDVLRGIRGIIRTCTVIVFQIIKSPANELHSISKFVAIRAWVSCASEPTRIRVLLDRVVYGRVYLLFVVRAFSVLYDVRFQIYCDHQKKGEKVSQDVLLCVKR